MSGVDLGDRRLNNRVVKLLEILSQQPSASIPDACGGWAETKAAYRLLAHDKIGWEDILAPHWAHTKERMRAENAIYGGEMSAHHYFRDFAYCDSGMIPWLLVAGLVCASGKPLSALIAERAARFPCSGEINSRVSDPAALLAGIEARYRSTATVVDHIDGLSMEFPDWRFNVRMSNTEPVVRLNVESRGDVALMEARRDELLALVRGA